MAYNARKFGLAHIIHLVVGIHVPHTAFFFDIRAPIFFHLKLPIVYKEKYIYTYI